MSGEFVAAMEDVLALYAQPYDARYPTVCLDEKPVVLHADVRPAAAALSWPRRAAGLRVRAARHRQSVRAGRALGRLAPRLRSPNAAPSRTTPRCCAIWSRSATRRPSASAWCRTTSTPTRPAHSTRPSRPEQARHILTRLEFHYTPKHGSWLNQAEIEISVFERGCLSRPVPDTATLQQRVQALEAERNERRATIDWQFTSRQARLKLKKLYPVVTTQLD